MNKQKGFTLIELMLAMAFLAFMLVFLMSTVVHMMRVYNKGVATRQINQSGRQFSEDFVRTVRYAKPQNVVYRPDLNRICANGITYAWNMDDPTLATATIRNSYLAPNTAERFAMVRVVDSGGSLCRTNATAVIQKNNAKELLPLTLNVKKLTLTTSSADPRLVSLSLLFSTGGNNAPLSVPTSLTGFECAPGGEGAYCAFADFDVTVYARN